MRGLQPARRRAVVASRVSLGDVPGTVLAVRGDYAGNGGLLHFSTALG